MSTCRSCTNSSNMLAKQQRQTATARTATDRVWIFCSPVAPAYPPFPWTPHGQLDRTRRAPQTRRRVVWGHTRPIPRRRLAPSFSITDGRPGIGTGAEAHAPRRGEEMMWRGERGDTTTKRDETHNMKGTKGKKKKNRESRCENK